MGICWGEYAATSVWPFGFAGFVSNMVLSLSWVHLSSTSISSLFPSWSHHGTLSTKMWWMFPGLRWSVHPVCQPKAGKVFSWVILKLFWIDDGMMMIWWWNMMERNWNGIGTQTYTSHKHTIMANSLHLPGLWSRSVQTFSTEGQRCWVAIGRILGGRLDMGVRLSNTSSPS